MKKGFFLCAKSYSSFFEVKSLSVSSDLEKNKVNDLSVVLEEGNGFWSSDIHTIQEDPNGGVLEWIEVEMETPQDFNFIELQPRYSGDLSNGFPRSFKVYVVDENNQKELIIDNPYFPVPISNKQTSIVIPYLDYEKKIGKTKKIRIEVTKLGFNEENEYCFQLENIKIGHNKDIVKEFVKKLPFQVIIQAKRGYYLKEEDESISTNEKVLSQATIFDIYKYNNSQNSISIGNYGKVLTLDEEKPEGVAFIEENKVEDIENTLFEVLPLDGRAIAFKTNSGKYLGNIKGSIGLIDSIQNENIRFEMIESFLDYPHNYVNNLLGKEMCVELPPLIQNHSTEEIVIIPDQHCPETRVSKIPNNNEARIFVQRIFVPSILTDIEIPICNSYDEIIITDEKVIFLLKNRIIFKVNLKDQTIENLMDKKENWRGRVTPRAKYVLDEEFFTEL